MSGVQFPLTSTGERSTTGFNKAAYTAIADVLDAPELSRAIASEKDWRHKFAGYLDKVVLKLAEVGCRDTTKLTAALKVGLEKGRAMDFGSTSLAQVMMAPAKMFETVRVQGSGVAKSDFIMPYGGSELRGPQLEAQCDEWAAAGTMEPSAAFAIKAGAQKMALLKGRTFLVLGAGSELGPVRPLLEAGATVAAVATRRPERWANLISFARGTAGTLLVPLSIGKTAANDDELARMAGADLLADAPGVAEWLCRCGKEASGPVTFSTYLYADGEANVRLTAAADYAAELAAKSLPKEQLSFAYLASCSVSCVVPEEAAKALEVNLKNASLWASMWGVQKQKMVVEGAPVPSYVLPSFEVMQGPNYALAQLMRQWRAVLFHLEGFVVSTPYTPCARTESVCHNATMATILEGMAYWHPLEAFDADTTRMAMLAILLTDLAEQPPRLPSPMHLFTQKSFHSGIWRCPFELSSLGTTTWVLGKLAPRKQPRRS